MFEGYTSTAMDPVLGAPCDGYRSLELHPCHPPGRGCKLAQTADAAMIPRYRVEEVRQDKKQPHPATIAQKRAPHPATVVERRAPHPATVAQKRAPHRRGWCNFKDA